MAVLVVVMVVVVMVVVGVVREVAALVGVVVAGMGMVVTMAGDAAGGSCSTGTSDEESTFYDCGLIHKLGVTVIYT